MKRLMAAGGLLLLVATAAAQNGSSQQVLVPAARQAAIKGIYTPPEYFRFYKGDYTLSNGKILTLERRNTRMYAKLSEQPEREIIRIGDGQFLARDGKLSVELALGSYGAVTGQLSYVEEWPVVAGLPPRLVSIEIWAR